jgi:hypothetical protein
MGLHVLVLIFHAYGGEEEYIYMVLVRKPEGSGPLGSPRHKEENNIVT